MSLNAVICGAGFIGSIHAKAYENIKGVTLKGIFDVNTDKVKDFSEKFKISHYDKLEDVLNDNQIDIIDICVPTFKHMEIIKKSVKAEKNILCEKPLALNIEDARTIIDIVTSSNIRFMVGHTHRFYKENLLVHEAAKTGKLGNILSCSAYRLGSRPDWSENNWIIDGGKSGGAATDFILHDIDLCNWIGGKPNLVMAQGIKSQNGAWDYMDISINYESGIKGFVEGGWMFKGEWPFTQEHRIMGEKGTAQWVSKMGKNIEGRNVADSKIGIFIEGNKTEYPEWIKKDPFEIEIEYFINCIKDNKPIEVVQPIDALRALQVSLAAKESAQTLKPVEI
jgi:UDP-N-acetylglucosamine 3-dehydrogenase